MKRFYRHVDAFWETVPNSLPPGIMMIMMSVSKHVADTHRETRIYQLAKHFQRLARSTRINNRARLSLTSSYSLGTHQLTIQLKPSSDKYHSLLCFLLSSSRESPRKGIMLLAPASRCDPASAVCSFLCVRRQFAPLMCIFRNASSTGEVLEGLKHYTIP